jgi:hypothetical protein
MGDERMDLKIRFAVPEDGRDLAGYVHIQGEILQRKIGFGEIIVASVGAELIGFLQLEYLWSKVPYIAHIHITDGNRQSGFGKKILDFTCRTLHERGHQTIYSSSQANEPEPQNWHRRMGFEECGVIHGINDGVDEIFFRKSLDAGTASEDKE